MISPPPPPLQNFSENSSVLVMAGVQGKLQKKVKHVLVRAVPPNTLRESRFSRILENFFPISLLDLDLEAFSFHFSLSK